MEGGDGPASHLTLLPFITQEVLPLCAGDFRGDLQASGHWDLFLNLIDDPIPQLEAVVGRGLNQGVHILIPLEDHEVDQRLGQWLCDGIDAITREPLTDILRAAKGNRNNQFRQGAIHSPLLHLWFHLIQFRSRSCDPFHGCKQVPPLRRSLR